MDGVFTHTLRVPMHHCDRFARMRPSALLSQVQEVAGAHAAILGVGDDFLNPKGLAWVVARHNIEIRKMPAFNQEVTFKTWPGKTTRVAYPRYCVGLDQQGEVLFRSATVWLLLDLKQRTMVLPGKGGFTFTGEDLEDQLSLPGSLPARDLANVTHRTVRYSQLDVNDHMNNAKYFDWMEDLLPTSFHQDHALRSVQINYATEAREGQQIQLSWQLDENGTLQMDARREGESPARIFAAKAVYSI